MPTIFTKALDIGSQCDIISSVRRKKMKNEIYENLFTQALEGDGKMLKAYSNFHNYSFGNQMYAMWQMMWRKIEVSPIATYKKWSELGRQVKKGSKALELCMPITKENEDGQKKVIFIYKKNWFAMSQTEGKDVEFKIPEYNFEMALENLNVTRETFQHTNGNVQGYAKQGRVMAVNPLAEMPEKTFFHELGHILLGHCDKGSEHVDEVETKRNLQEVEAESVALCCMLALGIEGIEYPRGYIKTWLRGEEIPIDSKKKIFKIANLILKAGQEKEA